MMRTYLYGYGNGPYGASTTRRTEQFIRNQNQWKMVEPEVLRRLFALADDIIDDGSDFGFGGGWRSSDAQLYLFLSRYERHASSVSGSFYWDGRPQWDVHGWWVRKPGVAAAAPPGRSYHEGTTKLGFALAADMVGDHAAARKFQAKHGLHDFSNVNNEPWHYQPVEIPNARSNYAGEAENLQRVPPLPPEPPTPEPELGDDIMLYIGFPAPNSVTGKKWHNDNTPWLAVFQSGVIRRAYNSDVHYAQANGIPMIPVDSQEQHADAVSKFPR